MFVIYSLTKRAFVAEPGRASSFTSRIEEARKFRSREEAKRECCGDEIPRRLAEILGINGTY